MADRYFLVAVDYANGTVCAGEVGNLDAIEPWQLPVIGEGCTENHGETVEEITSASADALRAVMPDVDAELAPNGLPWGDVAFPDVEGDMRERLHAHGWHRAADDAPAAELPALIAEMEQGRSVAGSE
jgi:hypothetical protein